MTRQHCCTQISTMLGLIGRSSSCHSTQLHSMVQAPCSQTIKLAPHTFQALTCGTATGSQGSKAAAPQRQGLPDARKYEDGSCQNSLKSLGVSTSSVLRRA